MWFSCIVQSGLFTSPRALTSLQGWCASVCVSSAALCVTSIGGVGSPGCRQLVLSGYEKHGGVYTWLSQEEMDWHGIDEAKGRASAMEVRGRGCCGTATGLRWHQHPAPFPACSGGTWFTSMPGQGLPGANFKRGRKYCFSELIFPCRACSPHYSGRYLSNSRSSLVVQQLREGLSARG